LLLSNALGELNKDLKAGVAAFRLQLVLTGLRSAPALNQTFILDFDISVQLFADGFVLKERHQLSLLLVAFLADFPFLYNLKKSLTFHHYQLIYILH